MTLAAIPERILIVLGILLAVYFLGRYQQGQADAKKQVAAAVAMGIVAQDREEALTNVVRQQGIVTERLVTQYVPQIQTIQLQGKTIVAKIPVSVPVGNCAIPDAARMLINAAATGNMPKSTSVSSAP